jgi:succinoglycan biosynthesis transport protein ExoP
VAYYPVTDANFHLDEMAPRTSVFRDFMQALRRHRLLVIGCALVGTLVGTAILLSMQPQYTAGASIVLDPRKPRVTDLPSVISEQTTTPEALQLRSETKILQSEELARRVITGLGLIGLPEFEGNSSPLNAVERQIGAAGAYLANLAAEHGGFGLPASLIDRLTPAPRASVINLQRDKVGRAIDAYLRRLTVTNDGRSYIIGIQFTSADPELAANIVNAHVELYLQDQVAFQRTATRQAAQWLREQIASLQVKQRSSEEAVQDFREANKIVVTGGTTLLSQQLGYLNSQLPIARAELSRRENLLRQARQLRDRGMLDSGSEMLN